MRTSAIDQSEAMFAVPPVMERTTKPVKTWALIGALFLAMEAYAFTAWIVSGKAQATPHGPTPIPTWMKVAVRGWEVTTVTALAAVLIFWLIRPWRRQGSPSFDGLLALALLTIYWQDPFVNWSQTWYTYNSYFLNFGSWTTNVPGWVSPNGNLIAEPILGFGAFYGGVLFFMCVGGCAFMRKLKARYPRMGKVGTVASLLGVFIVVDIAIEAVWMRLGFYTYAGSIGPLTLFHGHYYQFPLYMALQAGGWFTALACVRYFRNDHGESVAERGIREIRTTRRRQIGLRFLALCGLCNTIWLVTNITLQLPGLNADRWPNDIVKRSYLTDGFCGPGTTYACPGPGIPIPRQSSSHVAPDGSLVREPRREGRHAEP